MQKEYLLHAESDLHNQTKRLYFIDWLRILATVIVFLYHCDGLFDSSDWPVKNAERSIISDMHMAFSDYWMMTLLFFISGASVYYSLKSRSVLRFLKERILRILFPFLFLGCFIISPPQTYIHRLTHNLFSGNFFQFYPNYFKGFDLYGGNFAWHGHHLWYLLFLFIFTLILLPLFVQWGKSRKSFISRLSELIKKPLTVFLLFIPISAAEFFTDALGLRMTIIGILSLFTRMLFFIYGYLFLSNERILEIIKKYCLVFLTVAIAASVYRLILSFAVKPGLSFGTPFYFWIIFVRGITLCYWVMALLGLGMRFLNFNNKFLKYANEAVLPYYILHHLIIVVFGYYIVQLDMGIGSKFLITVVLSFIGIMVTYELLVRRFNIVRFLFGMKKI